MRRVIAFVAVLTLASCSTVATDETTTTSTNSSETATSVPPVATTSTVGRVIGGQLVKLDLETLTPEPGLEPIPVFISSSSIVSDDGEWIVDFDWATVTPIDVARWQPTGTFELYRRTARVIEGDLLFVYDDRSGRILSMDLRTGERSELGKWRAGLWLQDQLHVTSDGLVVGHGGVASDDGSPQASHWVHWLDPATGASGKVEVGPIDRVEEETGIFEGDHQVPEFDTPGVVWGDDRLFIAHASPLEVMVVDPRSGRVATHDLEARSWIDQLIEFWIPAAAAKGPSLGTYSSAALSADGRFLLVSGNRYDVLVNDDGTLDEENEALGLTVVDTEAWVVVARPELNIQFVRNAGDAVLGVETTSTSPWVDNVYLISTDETGAVTHLGPFTVDGGGCQPARGASLLLCSEYPSESAQRLRVIDTLTSETLSEREIGVEDHLDENGVLVDWSPIGD